MYPVQRSESDESGGAALLEDEAADKLLLDSPFRGVPPRIRAPPPVLVWGHCTDMGSGRINTVPYQYGPTLISTVDAYQYGPVLTNMEGRTNMV